MRLEQEEKAEEKRLAIMMMKKKEKYLYDKIVFGKKRKVREVGLAPGGLHSPMWEFKREMLGNT